MTLSSLLVTAAGTVAGIALGTVLRAPDAHGAPAPTVEAESAASAAPDAPAEAAMRLNAPERSAAEQRKVDAGLYREAALSGTGTLPHHHLGAVEGAGSEDTHFLQFGQPFVVALTRDEWTHALVVTTLAVEIERELIERGGTEAILRDKITAALVRASRVGLFDGQVPRRDLTHSVRQVVTEALGDTVPRGVEGVVITDMAKKTVRR